jgi:hypothetical protein
VAANPRVPVVGVAALAQDVHDLEGLRRIGALLAEGADPPEGGGPPHTTGDGRISG